jgi:adenylate cyclase
MRALDQAGRSNEALQVYERICGNSEAQVTLLGTPPGVKDVEGRKPATGRYAPSPIVSSKTLDSVESERDIERERFRRGLLRTFVPWFLALITAVIVGMGLWRSQEDSDGLLGKPRQLALPNGPSLVVLPFSNMSEDKAQSYFADGLTDTLITDLSRLHNILVIARNSSFTYKDRAVDVRQVGRELGVRHVLEGSVQSFGSRLRVNVQLTEAATGTHLWADRYDRPLEDFFLIQDEIASRIVEELDVTLVTGEQARTWRRMTKNPAAYSEVLAGRAIQRTDHSISGMLRQREHYRRSIKLDPQFALPWAYMVSVHQHLTDAGYDAEPGMSYENALSFAERAVELNPELPIARAYRGSVLQQLQRYEEAEREYKLAIQYGPNAAESLMLSAWGLVGVGNAREALPLALRALRLDPIPPGWYWGGLADTYLKLGRWSEAISIFERCLEESVDLIWCRAGLTAALVNSGRMDDARRSVQEWRKISPEATASDNFYLLAWRDPEFRTVLTGVFRQAGM